MHDYVTQCASGTISHHSSIDNIMTKKFESKKKNTIG